MRAAFLTIGFVLGAAVMWWWLPGGQPAPSVPPGELESEPAAIRSGEARPTVRLQAAQVALAGLDIVSVQAHTFHDEQATVGRIADTAAFMRALHAAAAARDIAAAQGATREAVQQRLARLRELQNNGGVGAARELAELTLHYHREVERSQQLAARIAAQVDELEVAWGRALVARVNADDALLAALTEHRSCIIEFAGAAAMLEGYEIFVSADSDRARAMPAHVLAPAPAVLAGTASPSYFASVPCGAWRASMRVSVWSPSGAAAVTGALLPATAVLWHGGERWVFVELEAGVYQRRRLLNATSVGADFVSNDVAPGQRIVTRGAQALLAEDQRDEIPDENDDD